MEKLCVELTKRGADMPVGARIPRLRRMDQKHPRLGQEVALEKGRGEVSRIDVPGRFVGGPPSYRRRLGLTPARRGCGKVSRPCHFADRRSPVATGGPANGGVRRPAPNLRRRVDISRIDVHRPLVLGPPAYLRSTNFTPARLWAIHTHCDTHGPAGSWLRNRAGPSGR
jgi:hypothetical protein